MASLHEIAREIEFVAAVRQGLGELDRDERHIPIEEIEKELPSWAISGSFRPLPGAICAISCVIFRSIPRRGPRRLADFLFPK